MSRPTLAALLGFSFVLLAACGSGERGERELLVLAPASLGGHLDDFNAPWADDGAEFSFAGSTTQVRAVIEGAEADVLITANPDVAIPIIDEFGFEPRPFVTNSLAIVTPAGNPAGVTTVADLSRPDLLVAVCAAEVPCGMATQQLPVDIAADTTEPNVRAVLTKVEEAAVDVGVVYASDAAIGRVDQPVVLTAAENVWTTYIVFNLTDRDVATDYVAALLTDGRDQLVDLKIGFDAP